MVVEGEKFSSSVCGTVFADGCIVGVLYFEVSFDSCIVTMTGLVVEMSRDNSFCLLRKPFILS